MSNVLQSHIENLRLRANICTYDHRKQYMESITPSVCIDCYMNHSDKDYIIGIPSSSTKNTADHAQECMVPNKDHVHNVWLRSMGTGLSCGKWSIDNNLTSAATLT